MLQDEKAKQPPPGLETKLGQAPPWVKKVRLQREADITRVEKLAVDADKFADFHTMRAEELRGN